MKSLLKNQLFIAFLFLLFSSCIVEEPFKEYHQITVQDVKSQLKSELSPISESTMRTDGFFEIPEVIWSEASYRIVSDGEVLDFPVDFQSNYYFGLAESEYIYLMEESTYLIAYKENEEIKINLVKKLPGPQNGSGYLLIEDIQGNLQRLFEYDGENYTELGFRTDLTSNGRLATSGRYECEWVVIGYIQAGNAEPEPKTDYICKWVANPRESLSGEDFGGGIDSPNRGGGGTTTACNTKTHEIYNNQCVPKCEFGRGTNGICLSEADNWEEEVCTSGAFDSNNCINSVWAKLKSTNAAFNILSNFENSGWIELCLDTYQANTNNKGLTSKSGSVITIKLNENKLNRSQLDIARTFLHELVHAELYRKVASVNNSISITNFPGIYDYYRRYIKNWQHQQMAGHYINSIAAGLALFDSNNHTESFYKDIAWLGLWKIPDYNTTDPNDLIESDAWKSLSSQEQNRIKNSLVSFKNSENKNCQ